MSWNYRVLVYPDGDGVFYQMHEVYYNDTGKPDGYTENAIGVVGENTHALHWCLTEMRNAIHKPFLWAGERFPEEYEKEE